MTTQAVTFCHQIANSTCYLQEPGGSKDAPNPVVTATFSGKPGAAGFFQTDVPWQISELDKLAKNPQVQVTRVDATLETATDASTPAKAPDPAIQQARREVTEQAATAADPKVVAAQDNLAQLLAASAPRAA